MINKQVAIAEAQLIIVSAVKSYEANWLDGGQTVTRDEGGKFASKSGGDAPENAATTALRNTFKDLPEEQQQKLRKQLKVSKETLDKLGDNFEKMSPEEQKILKDFISSPNYKKGVDEVGKIIKSIDPKSGAVFDKTVGKVEGIVKKENTLSRAMKAMGDFVQNTVESAKEHPEIVLAGAMAATLAVAGGAGAVALFSLPNLFGVGGVWGGLSAVMGGEGIATITGAFATGGLSQLGFGFCSYLAIAETMVLAKNTGVLVSKEAKKAYENALKEVGDFEKQLLNVQKDLMSQGLVTKDGYATPKYIKMLKDSGQLKSDYPDDKPYKIPFWKA